MEEIILLGIGGHAHSVVDSIEQSGKYHIAGFLDLKENLGIKYKGYEVVGTDDMMSSFLQKGIKNAFVTVGYLGYGEIREKLYHRLVETGFQVPNIIDKTATLANNIKLGNGIFIGKQAVVNANAEIGDMCIINSTSVIEHDCRIGEFSHVAVGGILCGGVQVGNKCFIGAGTVITQEVLIGENTLIGAGTTITKNVSDGIIKYGKIERKRDEK